MENIENVNLGNVMGNGAVPPVFGTTEPINNVNVQNVTVGIDQNNTQEVNNVNVETALNNNATKAEPVEQVSTEPAQPEVKVFDNFVISTDLLRSLINGAKKVVSQKQHYVVKAQVVGLEFGPDGVKVSASDEDTDYERIDTNYRYSKYLKICADISKISDLLGYTDFESVEIKPLDNQSFSLSLPIADYAFAQINDPSTQQPIDLSLKFPIAYDDMTPINYDAFVEAINSSKAIRTSKGIDENLRGVLFSNRVIATDYSLMFIEDNQDILKTQRFFIGNELCSLIADTNFDANKFRIGFTTDTNNDVIAITLSDGKITLCGKVILDVQLPEESIETFWDVNPDVKIKINTKKLYNAFNRISLFQNEELDDYIHMEVSNYTLTVKTNNFVGVDGVTLSEPVVGTIKCQLPFTKLRTILSGIKESEIYLIEDKSQPNSIYLDVGQYKWVVAKMDVE